ncbi:MAG TPA: DUF4013 domain-containing protein [Methanoregula sp.]|nr:DUF4013 domain-containing protein [Methanoregula sp.]
MDNGLLVTGSIAYAKEALIGKWTRWLIFIICGLPFALLPFAFDTKKMADAATFSWDMVPWGTLAALFLAGLLLSFFTSGYLARIYRGVNTPPEFDNWGVLFVDGIKLAIVGFLWFLPMAVVGVGILLVIFSGLATGSMVPSGLAIGLVIFLLIVEGIVAVIAIIYSMMGVVRCARTGSIREGIRFSALTTTLRSIGWTQYIIALIVLLVLSFVFFLVTSIFTIIPPLGAAVQLILTPLFTVFAARYVTRVYEHGLPPSAATENP